MKPEKFCKLRLLAFISLILVFLDFYPRITVRGVVFDSDSLPTPGVIVRLEASGIPKGFSTSAKDGSFSISVEKLELPASMRFISQKHETLSYPLDSIPEYVKIYLTRKDFVLQEVVVKAPERRIKGDTIIYDVAALTKAGDRTIEDIIRKIPGIQIDDSGGISYDGLSINHFYIEDMDLMGKNYTVASRSINPDDISTVSVYERHQDKRVLQGKQEAEKASLNLKLKKGRMLKPLGYLKGGAGVGSSALWDGDLYGMLISAKNQTIISGKGNNMGSLYTRPDNTDNLNIFPSTPFGEPSIPKDRFIKNKSAFTTANSLFKFNSNLNVKINSSFGYNRNAFDGSSVTEYLNPDEASIIYAERADNSLRNRNVEVTAAVENNGNNLYLNNTFNFNGDFVRNAYDVSSSTLTRQHVRSDRYLFSNNLKTIITHRGNLYEITSDTKFRNTPVARMQAINPDGNTDVAWQNLTIRRFHNREYTSISRQLMPRLSVGASISFEIDHDSFISAGERDNADRMRNDISGYRISTSTEPFIKINIHGIIWKTSMPIRLLNIKYHDVVSNSCDKSDMVLVDFKSQFSKKFNQRNHATLSFGRENNVGDIRDFIDNPIYTTFRNVRTLGTGKLERGHDDFIRINYSYRNILQDLYLISGLSVKRTEKSKLSVSDVSQSGVAGSVKEERNNAGMATMLLNLTKGIRSINTTFHLNANALLRSGESMRSAMTVTTKNSILVLNGRIETYQFSDMVSITAGATGTWQRQTFGGVLPSNSTNSFSITGKLGVYPLRNIEIFYKTDYSRVKMATDNYRTNLFMDAGVIWTLRKIDFQLDARNLTDRNQYAYTLYNSLDINYYSYSLRPFEIILSVKYRF